MQNSCIYKNLIVIPPYLIPRLRIVSVRSIVTLVSRMLQVTLLKVLYIPVHWLSDTGAKRKHKHCGECANCKRDDCGACKFCKDKTKFGGPNRKRQSCELKQCLQISLQLAIGNKLLLLIYYSTEAECRCM